jgi:hypothetical protein
MFAAAFWLEAVARGVRVLTENPSEAHPLLVALRIVAYGLILLAIADKNFGARSR